MILMTILKHELNQNFKMFLIWTLAIGFFIMTCIFIYPEMKGEMGDISDIFASLGSFSEAFGLDKISFGTLVGFYTVECGNILGIGGAFFAALIAISSISKEENLHTAEFLLTHPVKRSRILFEKLISVLLQIIILNIFVFLLSIISIIIIKEEIIWKDLILIHLAYLLSQIEIAGICFGISAFLRRGGLGLGLGIATVMYFLNIVANLSNSVSFLKYITPFGYTDGADIVESGIDAIKIFLGMGYAIILVTIAFLKYQKKDIS